MRAAPQCARSNAETRAYLSSAYCNTTYQLDASCRPIALRIGQRSAELEALLADRGVRAWAFITAQNPGSTRLPAEQNNERHARLIDWLESRGIVWLPGRSIADDGSWPPEVSVLALGLSRADALALGRQFGQNAVVIGEAGGVAELAWCAE